jgi:hypothetical protein
MMAKYPEWFALEGDSVQLIHLLIAAVLTGLLVLHNESQHDTPTAILKKMFAA